MIDEDFFLKSLDEVIDKNDEIIVLYSGIWTFINKINFKLKKKISIPSKILDLIELKVGKNRTLIMPSFSGGLFNEKKIFDIDTAIDKNNGLLSVTALKRKYYRTPNPIHSYLIYGNKKDIKKYKFTSSWGKNSILEYFSKKNVRICNLGLPWNKGCAYLHRFEEKYKVPWRYQKNFKGKIKRNKKIIGNCFEKKFCSSIIVPLKYDYKPFIKDIEKAKSFKKSSNKLFKFESIKASCLNKIGKKIFDNNPWIIVKNKKQTVKWIKNIKKVEMNKATIEDLHHNHIDL